MAMTSTRLHKFITLLILLSIYINLPSAFSQSSATPISSDAKSSSCRVGADHETCTSSMATSISSNSNSNSNLNNNSIYTMLYSIILPTDNERENPPLITQFLHDAFAESKLTYEIVVVDDSSPDGTLEVANSLQKIFGEENFRYLFLNY
jgi:dolichol-phosphate mannosyltransferase